MNSLVLSCPFVWVSLPNPHLETCSEIRRQQTGESNGAMAVSASGSGASLDTSVLPAVQPGQ